ncbi:MAG: type IV pilin N-terminal domain-containing protein [Methanoregula sp.]|jgi:FlaG/FlaF family flagellin (archaellin)|uniref:type IV pilin N-terminal domain-containing protein n=1 Tax=Methanoregula sp. TaxID=2052170 RepID=UPI0025F6A2F5|nr:type IV pilin N-terminal domain-containing protein [Methanoregula sp.]MCK9630601.1 type IV pilin N-terminal domain-containing protein [Methanoregula sp.]
MKPSNHNAVSPVIGVMLMLVVVIIIAAVVSAFAGGTMASNSKTPQATIKGVFSQSGGMQIIHTGGDVLPTAPLLFTITSDASFGQGLSSVTTEVIQKGIITDDKGNQLLNVDGTSNVTSFAPGQTLYINVYNLDPAILQPQISPSSNPYPSMFNGQVWKYAGGTYRLDFWGLCYVNPDNVGKTFTLTISDKSSGAVMAKTSVVIQP